MSSRLRRLAGAFRPATPTREAPLPPAPTGDQTVLLTVQPSRELAVAQLRSETSYALTIDGQFRPSGDYVRIRFGDRSQVLRFADLPAEIVDAASVLIVADDPLTMWRKLVHPNTAVRLTGEPLADAELAQLAPARYLISRENGSAGLAPTALTAELLYQALTWHDPTQRGLPQQLPWETPVVQALCDLGQHDAAATITLRSLDRAADDLALALAEVLDWQFQK